MNSLFIDEEFVAVQPSLVRALEGRVIDALVLQYLHFWLRVSTNEHLGEKWVYNTYSDWSEKLGISVDQARRSVKRLQEQGLVLYCQPHCGKYDQTKWYRIDYNHDCLLDLAKSPPRSGENTILDVAESPSRSGEIAESSISTVSTTESTITVKKKRPSTRTRTAKDDVWDSLVAAFGEPTTSTSRAFYGKVSAELSKAGATAAQVKERHSEAKKRWSFEFTPQALLKHWDSLAVKSKTQSDLKGNAQLGKDYLGFEYADDKDMLEKLGATVHG